MDEEMNEKEGRLQFCQPITHAALSRCVATFMARMGQCFSTSTDTIAIIPEETGIQFEDIDDVTIDTADQTYTFSDGVGTISLNVAKKVKMSFKLSTNFLVSFFPASSFV